MPIDLGLIRISKLLGYIGNPHYYLKFLHVGGTNGKGSICSYLNSCLLNQSKNNQRIGKFTSPYLCHITDSITVDNIPIALHVYETLYKRIQEMDQMHNLKCTEFEILTCIAFKYFYDLKCSWCIMEVGLGGRLDSTNVMKGVSKICGISKIGMDHENILGASLENIAQEKAGIITEGVKFVAIDGSNDSNVLDVISKRAQLISSKLTLTNSSSLVKTIRTDSWGTINLDKLSLYGEYQTSNASVAILMLDYLQHTNQIHIKKEKLIEALANVEWPGRLQHLEYQYSRNKTFKLLLDGAHNGSAAIELGKYLDSDYRCNNEPLTFIISITQGKDVDALLKPLLRFNDHIIITSFGSVDHMPWVIPMNIAELELKVRKYTHNIYIEPDLLKIVPQLEKTQHRHKVVVCGSLYLCGSLLSHHYSNL